jgi:hypothetical protein
MNLMASVISIVFLTSTFSVVAVAKDELTIQGVLSVAKMTGACGILQAQSAFQASTKLEGGDKFIERFWRTEAARLGKTPDQYLKDCQAAISAYDKMWKLSEKYKTHYKSLKPMP